VAVRIEAVKGDITHQQVDAIVNAANSSLLGGRGVDGAIHAAAGRSLLIECNRLRRTSLPDGLPVGDAVATTGGRLAARWVIHTVGPNAHAGETDPALVASCFTRSLEVAAELGARTVAVPAVSAGAYGWDVEQVAKIAVATVHGWLADRARSGGASIELVRFVLFNRVTLAAFRAQLTEHVTPAANTGSTGEHPRLA
jgi:O-acetyl-ADP-ribose deacetylase (regulator of RNase III)